MIKILFKWLGIGSVIVLFTIVVFCIVKITQYEQVDDQKQADETGETDQIDLQKQK